MRWLAVAIFAGFLGLGMAAQTAASQAAGSHPCSLPGLGPDAKQELSDADLLAAWNAQSARVRSLEASAAVRGWAGTTHSGRPSPALLYFRAPAWLRSTGEVPFSNRRTVDLFSNGRDFWLLTPDGKRMRLFTGPVDAPPASSDASANLRPRPLIDALHWEAGTLSAAQSPAPPANGRTRTIELDLPAEAPFPARTAAVEFDLRAGVVDGVAIRDALQRQVLELHYSEWQTTDVNSCYPRHIGIVQPLGDRKLDIRIAVVRLNSRIEPGEFRMIAPIGVPVTQLGGTTVADQP
jgi:hypothetical protein